MSKLTKQMEMTVLRNNFEGVTNLVVLRSERVDAAMEYNTRATLRKKNIRMQMVKNTLARRVLGEMGVTLDDTIWQGPTVLAWGPESVKELSLAIDGILTDIAKKNPKLKDKMPLSVKAAVAEKQQITFEQAKKMPTRLEAIGEIVAMIMGPASQIAGCLQGPASQVASQIATIADKKEDEPAAADA